LKYFKQSSAIIAVLFLAGCSATHDAAWPESRPLGETIPAYRPPIDPDPEEGYSSPADSVSETLTLPDALARALRGNPSLQAYGWEVRAREASALQAGLVPNPEIGLDVENFGGTGDLSGFDASEITLGLSQLIELGGDRRRRRDVAEYERDLAGWTYEAVRLDVLTATVQAFASLLAGQQRLGLADSLYGQAQRFYESVDARVKAGKVSGLEERRAQVVLSTARIEAARAIRDLDAARKRLSSLWGGIPFFDRAAGAFHRVESVPLYDAIEDVLSRNPDLERWHDELALARAGVALEGARAIPNPTVMVGPRWHKDLGQTSFVAGVAIPIPIFDRRQGAKSEAKYRVIQAEAIREAVLASARQALADAYARLSSAQTDAEALQDEILPAATENYEATDRGYREGKFDLLMVLDAQRTLFETTNRYVDALEDYHTARADVERLIATPLSDISNQ
jgi:cobalt-zinc-cadmium efflux system outer membrane protein